MNFYKILPTIIFVFLSSTTFCQTKLSKFYNLTYQADSCNYYGDSAKQLLYLNLALASLPKNIDPPSRFYFDLADANLKFKNYKSYFLFFSKGIQLSNNFNEPLASLTSKEFIIEKTKFHHQLPLIKKEANKYFNPTYKRKIDSLFELDQIVIRRSTRTKDEFNLRSLNIEITDSIIFNDILSLFYTYGFPTERKVGFQTNNHFTFLLLHALRFQRAYDCLLDLAFQQGGISPDDYANIIDNALMYSEKKPKFYVGTQEILQLNQSEIESINNEREKLGIRKTYHFSYENTDYGFMISRKYLKLE
jgi:hypothetical protein